jgi:hypothetical protein
MAQPTKLPRYTRHFAWAGTAALILVPLALIKAADSNAWALEDLPFAFVMIAAVGIAAEVALRLPPDWTRAAGTFLAAATGLLLVWSNLAVGFAGSEEERINLIFFAVPVVALGGSLIARFRSEWLAKAFLATAGAQLVAGVVALAAGHFAMPLTVAFTGLWLVSALLFRRAALEAGTAATMPQNGRFVP